MATVGTLTVDLIAQTAAFNANIEKAASNLNSNAARMNRAVSGVQKNLDGMARAARAASFALAGAGLVELAKGSLEYAASLGETAQQIGVTSRDLQVYRAIGIQVGVTQEDMDKGLAKLTVSLGRASVGAKAQNDAFAALGISTRDASGHVKGTGSVIEEIADKLKAIPDPAQRAAIEVALFGKAGQKLDNVLTGGKQGIEDYAKRAEDLGMVLSDELINKADRAADRVAELNAQLKANIAQAVAANADAIYGMANALATLTFRAIEYINKHPQLVSMLTGLAIGGRIGGLPGAAIGALSGHAMSATASAAAKDANMDLEYRRQKLSGAKDVYERAKAASGSPAFYATKKEEYEKQQRLYNQAFRAAALGGPSSAKAVPAVADLPNFMAGGGGGGRARSRGAAAKDPYADSAEKFGREMDQIGSDILRVKRESLTSVEALASLDKEMVANEADRARLAIIKDVNDKHLTASQGAQLEIANAILAVAKQEQIEKQKQEQLLRDATDLKLAANDNERDILSAQLSLADTADQRKTLQLRLLDLEKQQELAKLDEILASQSATDTEKQIANARKAQLDAIYGTRAQAVSKENAGPLQQYVNGLALTPDKINEALQNVKARGLDSLKQGLVDAIMGVRSLGDVFKNVAAQILADLLKIQIEKMIIGPLANALGGGGCHLPKFAEGTNNAPSGLALVGERGPEIVRFRGGEQVIPNHRIRNTTQSSGGNVIHVNVNGAMSQREARETGNQVARTLQQRLSASARTGIAA